MKALHSFLDKFKRILKDDREIIDTIIKTIQESIGVELKSGDIKIQNKILYIKTNPIIKNEMYLKKDSILTTLRSRITNKIINDIK
ncbi:hypothetical protein COB64_01970 [Candidatus Wolfebacteria bacterium]|nr:MAG: hypothetical protein COB64_01970 [Candidatus Wolfebacteria bacterium]